MKTFLYLVFFVCMTDWFGSLNAVAYKESLKAPQVYYVSKGGKNTNNGLSVQNSLRSINAAVAKMQAGDTCVILKGTYRENVTIKGENLSFVNYKDDKVVLSGLDEVTDWKKYRGNIYRAIFIPVEKEKDLNVHRHLGSKGGLFTQVFANGDLMEISKFPNQQGDILNWENHGSKIEVFVDGTFRFMVNPDGYRADDFFTGAIFHGMIHKKFSPVQAEVQSSRQDTYSCKSLTKAWASSTKDNFKEFLFSHRENGIPSGFGKGFIVHHINAIDKENEWYWDRTSNYLYFYPPKSSDPNGMKIEAKSRVYAISISFSKNILFSGIDVKSAGVEIKNSSACVVENSQIDCPVPFYRHNNEFDGFSTINIIDSHNCTLRNSIIARSWGSGVSINGGTNNTLENNLIEDVNWMGNYNACINLGGKGTRVIRNTLRKSGRFIVYGVGVKQGEIAYNDMYNCMLIGQDGGVFYTNGALGDGTVLEYNWIHDVKGVVFEDSKREDHNIRVGIYLDGGCKDFQARYNVIWGAEYAALLTPGGNTKTSEGNIFEHNTCFVDGKGSIVTFNEPKLYKNNSYRYNLTNKKIGALGSKEGNVWDMDNSYLKKYFSNNSFSLRNTEKRSGASSKISSDKQAAGAYSADMQPWHAGSSLQTVNYNR